MTVLPEEGCRIGSVQLRGIELLRVGVPGAQGCGCFPMVPWAGRMPWGRFDNGPIRHQLPLNSPPHAIHGTGRDVAWRQAGTAGPPQGDSSARPAASAAFVYDLAAPWPYPGTVTQTFELARDELRVRLAVETAGDSFPAQAGWHPWFRRNLGRGGAAKLDFTPAWQEERDADHLLTGRRIDPLPGPWDDCFAVPGGVDATITWPGVLALRITSSAEWAVIYDEPADALCVEPQSGPPGGLTSHPRLVTLIDPLEVDMVWRWRSDTTT